MHFLIPLFLGLLMAHAQAAIVHSWKAEAALTAFHYSHQQRGDLGDVNGSTFITNSLALSLKRRFSLFEVELNYRSDQFNLKLGEKKEGVRLQDLSAGIIYRRFTLNLERKQTLFAVSDVTTNFDTLNSTWLSLGYSYRFKPYPFIIGVEAGIALSGDLESQEISGFEGQKFQVYTEYWNPLRVFGLKSLIWSNRIFYEGLGINFQNDLSKGRNDMNNSAFGLRLGIAKLF